MIFKLFLSLLIINIIQVVQAQEKFEFYQDMKDRKIGIYENYDEFLQNHPSILKPFKIIYKISIDKETNDTIQKGLTYQFLDSSKIIKNVWGLYDGTKVYFHVSREIFSPINYVGRYTFFLLDEKDKISFPFLPAINATTVLDIFIVSALTINSLAAKHPSKKKLYYYNEKGKLIEATSQAIGWLIRKDKDLVNEIQHEKNHDINTYIKYLIKMNERYPL